MVPPAHCPARGPAPHPRREEEVQVLVQQGLVAGVPRTELLQELVCAAQDLQHLGIALAQRERVLGPSQSTGAGGSGLGFR